VVTVPSAPGAGKAGVTAPQLRALLWRAVSITRSGAGLAAAEHEIGAWLAAYRPRTTRPAVELANMLLVGWLMARSALAREESRGAHYRSDFPESRPGWRRRLSLHLERPQPLQLR
jgi:L-aspartate oxidase